MANRHKAHHKAKGGKMDYAEESHKVEHEAGLKRGGKAKKHHRAEGGKVTGFKSGGRLDKRARGGGVGADKHPFSSAKLHGSAGSRDQG